MSSSVLFERTFALRRGFKPPPDWGKARYLWALTSASIPVHPPTSAVQNENLKSSQNSLDFPRKKCKILQTWVMNNE
jgi:hypothetical protein